jgi:hypothetical protein
LLVSLAIAVQLNGEENYWRSLSCVWVDLIGKRLGRTVNEEIRNLSVKFDVITLTGVGRD